MLLDRLPPVNDIRFRQSDHTYWAWAYRSERWVQVRSVSGIKRDTGLSSFNRGPWALSLVRKGFSRSEAEAEMDRHMKERASIGTAFHDGVEACCLGKPLEAAGEPLDMLQVWGREFFPRIQRVLLIEQPIVHRFWFFAGMPDMVAVLDDGQVWLLDWKTKPSRAKCKASPDWAIQLAAYKALVQWQYGLTVDRAANVMVAHDGLVFSPWSIPEVDSCGGRFREALLSHHELRSSEGCCYHGAINEHLLRAAPCLPPLWV